MGGLRGARSPLTAAAREKSLVVVVPGPINTPTGGYVYDREMIAGLRQRGWSVHVRELVGSYPLPSPADRTAADSMLSALPEESLVLLDGLALGSLPEEAGRVSSRLRLVALVHHPLADETGLAPEVKSALFDSERRALQAVRRVVVTSAPTAAGLARYDVAPAKITVIEPGTERAPLARGSPGAVIELLCVASVVPRKGHDILVHALTSLRSQRCHLTCVGGLTRDVKWAARLQAQIRDEGLDDRITFVGDIGHAALDAYYDAADVFVLPTWYEGYGMVVAEALARGLPVVSTATGAIADLVGSEAGLLVPPGDVPALAAALTSVVQNTALRARLAEGARRVRDRLPTWDDAVQRMESTLEAAGG